VCVCVVCVVCGVVCVCVCVVCVVCGVVCVCVCVVCGVVCVCVCVCGILPYPLKIGNKEKLLKFENEHILSRGVTLTPHPLRVPWSRKSRAILLLPLRAVRPVQSLSACTREYFNFTFILSDKDCDVHQLLHRAVSSAKLIR